MLVKVEKLKTISIYFVILLTIQFTVSCGQKNFYNYETITSKININDSLASNTKIEKFIAPYKTHITKTLDSILAYSPVNFDKTKGLWESNIGLLLAKITYQLGNPVFIKQQQKQIDFVLLNHGGIRAPIPKGNVTTRTAFNVMPFENNLMVVALSGLEIRSLATYILNEKKPHPMYGIELTISKNLDQVKSIRINNSALEDSKIYHVATSDYLANGGDNMSFFKESNTKFNLNYKLRDVFIDYFKKVDTLEVISTQIIIEE